MLTRHSLYWTGNWYSGMSQWHEEPSRGERHPNRAWVLSSGHARMKRAVLRGGLTIETLPDNMTRVVEDSGKYYTWRSFGPGDQRTQELWVDMSDARRAHVRVHGILSNTYKQAAVSLFMPPRRRQPARAGGFIFTGDITHRMLTATQYIAPLMANFDPSYSKDSTVQYLDDGEVFVVQWERVRLMGEESKGAFTFQAALYKTGDITFSYREMPLTLDVMSSAEHSVKAGLSDAFMVATASPQSPDVRRQTIYEYHRVEIDTTKITSNSAVEFTALPTCLRHDSCELCLSSNQTSGCSWCNVLQRCSDGVDRHRQEWLDYACSDEVSPDIHHEHVAYLSFLMLRQWVRTDSSTKTNRSANTGLIAGIAAAMVLLLALILVPLYINCHPTASPSASPLYLIQRRKNHWPSWKFQKQQPGYTEVEGEGHEKDSTVEAGTH
uniref:Uncharacterized protein n=1 Tax=Mola mola TaxID=94237 RepID=A0A3Q3X937_MOLML